MNQVSPLRLFETHVTVNDLDLSARFYEDGVGLQPAYRLDARRVALFWIGGPGHSMLGVWEGGPAPLGFHGEPTDEAVVIGWMPATHVRCRVEG